MNARAQQFLLESTKGNQLCRLMYVPSVMLQKHNNAGKLLAEAILKPI
jgi:hypothetical protein